MVLSIHILPSQHLLPTLASGVKEKSGPGGKNTAQTYGNMGLWVWFWYLGALPSLFLENRTYTSFTEANRGVFGKV